jgi:leucyl aminopeptidase
VEHITGEALQIRYPAMHAVGAGSERGPEAVLLRWQGSQAGAGAPLISLCGKGVCFDTGGYDLKPSSAMLRMKKDMGGAAILLGLAQAVMSRDLPVRLQLRLGCVENSISGHAMRPSDVLQTHAGMSVEVGNTDAEGRLVLCDLLAEAAAESPDWLIDAETLTGAARVALGPDLPALFCTKDDMADMILRAGLAENDPLWRLPLHDGYDNWLDSPIADFSTVSSKPLAGAIIAALFLRRFVPQQTNWAHIDVYAWNDSSRPGRPEGGEAQILRALYAAIETRAVANSIQS